jgi:hypothetical protein
VETVRTATSATTTTTEKHLKDVIRIHTAMTMPLTTLINFFEVHSLIVHLFFLSVAQHGIGLTNVLKPFFSLLHGFLPILLMLVRMPLNCLNFVRFFYFWLACILTDLKNLVVIFSLGFF